VELNPSGDLVRTYIDGTSWSGYLVTRTELPTGGSSSAAGGVPSIETLSGRKVWRKWLE
jgi:hypothetical protein